MAVLHDYECNECGEVTEHYLPFDQREINCKCGGVAHRIVSRMRKEQMAAFVPYYEESLGDDVPLVTSERHLAEMCQERGLVSRRLMEGYRNFGRKREL